MKFFQFFILAYCLPLCTIAQEDIFTIRLINEEVLKHIENAQYKKAISKGNKAYNACKKMLGEEHIETLAIGNNLALSYDYSGLFRKAETLYLKLLRIKKRQYGLKHTTTLLAMNNLGSFYQEIGDPQKSLSMLLPTYSMQQQILGKTHPDTLTTMQNLAALYSDLSLFEKSEQLHTECYALLKQLLGEDHPHTLTEYANFAFMYIKMGKFTIAAKMLEHTWKKRKKILGIFHPHTLFAKSNLASVYREMGQYKLAIKMYQDTANSFSKKLGENHSDTLMSYANLAVCYQDQGNYKKSEKLLRYVLKKQQVYLGNKHNSTLTSLNNLAVLLEEKSQFNKAQQFYIKSLKFTEQNYGAHSIKTLTTKNNLANLFLKQGHTEKAQAIYLSNLKISKKFLGELHPFTVSSAHNLISLYLSKGSLLNHADLVEDTYHKASKVWGVHHPTTVKSGTSVAWMYVQLGKFKKAEQLYITLLQNIHQVVGENHPHALVIQRGLADIYMSNRKFLLAQKIYKQIQKTIQNIFGAEHPETLLAIKNLASCYASLGKYRIAMKTYDESLKRTHIFIRRVFEGSNEQTKLTLLKKYDLIRTSSLKFYFSLLQSEVIPKEIRQKAQNKIFEISLLYKSLVLFSAKETHKQAIENPKLRNEIQLLNQKRNLLSKLFLKSPLDLLAYQEQVQQTTQQIEELEQKLGEKTAVYNTYKYVQPKHIQKQLQDHQAVVDFLAFECDTTPTLLTIIVRKSEIVVIPSTELTNLQKDIKKFNEEITLQLPIEKTSNTIYKNLWMPLEKYLTATTKVYLIADDALHLLAFNALIDNNQKYLIEKISIEPLTMARNLVEQSKYTSSGNITIFSAPDYGNANNSSEKRSIIDLQFQKLPFTQTEAESIAQIARSNNKKSYIFSGEKASKQQILKIKSPQILHIATHGFFLESNAKSSGNDRGFTNVNSTTNIPALLKKNPIVENPLLKCGLAFSNANVNNEGIMTALEVLSLNLTNTQLVVLSACETGVGSVEQGEGVYSLQRAFQQAGAGAVLSTLWILDDRATNIFMKRFYQSFLGGTAPQKSLRKTQLAFLHSQKYQHPYFWAPFTMNGLDHNFNDVTQNKNRKQQNANYLWIIAIIFIALLLIFTFIIFSKKKQQKAVEQRQKRRQKRLSNRI
ncbi:tetratricopeptide repeat protein [Candidatus Uabimicrobium sp. HlEnr_7]|uniref:tetratricopeptide repeat protein n=1 Tax=Candidatus Uabimicrobium helgolandensis TaxID=3095367 RepID=UPI0035579C78